MKKQKEDVPANLNDNDSDIEEKSEETEPKRGFGVVCLVAKIID